MEEIVQLVFSKNIINELLINLKWKNIVKDHVPSFSAT